MLTGLREPGNGVDADQSAPRAGLSSGAHDHAQAEGNQGDGHGEPEIDNHFRGAAHEPGGCPERCVHNEGAKECLPQLVSVGGPGEPTTRTPRKQERDSVNPSGMRDSRPDPGWAAVPILTCASSSGTPWISSQAWPPKRARESTFRSWKPSVAHTPTSGNTTTMAEMNAACAASKPPCSQRGIGRPRFPV